MNDDEFRVRLVKELPAALAEVLSTNPALGASPRLTGPFPPLPAIARPSGNAEPAGNVLRLYTSVPRGHLDKFWACLGKANSQPFRDRPAGSIALTKIDNNPDPKNVNNLLVFLEFTPPAAEQQMLTADFNDLFDDGPSNGATRTGGPDKPYPWWNKPEAIGKYVRRRGGEIRGVLLREIRGDVAICSRSVVGGRCFEIPLDELEPDSFDFLDDFPT